MTRQGSLFADPSDDHADREREAQKLARSDDPKSSHAAARDAVRFAGVHEERILETLRGRVHALTYREIAKAAGLEDVAVARRLRAMSERGLIYVAAFRACTVRPGKEVQAWRIRGDR